MILIILVKVVDMAEIMGYGVLPTHGLVINGKLKSHGKVLAAER